MEEKGIFENYIIMRPQPDNVYKAMLTSRTPA